jgi:hypothetical protein
MIQVTLKKERKICERINDELKERSTKSTVVLGTKNIQVYFQVLSPDKNLYT